MHVYVADSDWLTNHTDRHQSWLSLPKDFAISTMVLDPDCNLSSSHANDAAGSEAGVSTVSCVAMQGMAPRKDEEGGPESRFPLTDSAYH